MIYHGFDVEGLFTNKPLVERISYLAVKYIEGNPGLKLCTAELRSLFRFAAAQTCHKLPYLDVLIHNDDNHLRTTEFGKRTFMGLLINFFNFTASCYTIGLIRALVDKIFRINDTCVVRFWVRVLKFRIKQKVMTVFT